MLPGRVVTEIFTGVLLWDLLNEPPVNGIVTDPNVKNDILHKAAIVGVPEEWTA